MKPIRIMSFNILNSGAQFKNREQSIAALIRSTDPDLIGLQEFTDEMIPYLSCLTESYGFTGKARASQQSNERCCVVYRKSRFRLLSSKTFWLSDTPEVPGSKYVLSMFPRIVTVAVLEDLENRNIFTFANTHLDHLLPPARKQQTDTLRKLLKENRKGDFLFLTGDFNCTLDSEAARAILDDPELNLKNTARYSRKDRLWDFVHMASSRYRPIDIIFVSKELEVKDFTPLSGLYEGKYPSDHTPIIASVLPPEQEDEETSGKISEKDAEDGSAD